MIEGLEPVVDAHRREAELQDPNGLTHLRARQYDPITGIFLSTDPAAATSYSGTYTYGSANPLRYRDITGLDDWDWIEFWDGVAQIAAPVSEVSGLVSWVTGGGGPIGTAASGLSIAASTTETSARAIIASNTCSSGKGSCGDDLLRTAIAASEIPPGMKAVKGTAAAAKAIAGKEALKKI